MPTIQISQIPPAEFRAFIDAQVRVQMRRLYPGDDVIHHTVEALGHEAGSAGWAAELRRICEVALSLPRPRMLADPTVAGMRWIQTYDDQRAYLESTYRRLTDPSMAHLVDVPAMIASEGRSLRTALQLQALALEQVGDEIFRQLAEALVREMRVLM